MGQPAPIPRRSSHLGSAACYRRSDHGSHSSTSAASSRSKRRQGNHNQFQTLKMFPDGNLEDVEQIRTTVAQRLSPLDKKVYAIVNYDGFRIDPDLINPYFDMVKWLTDHFYSGVTRYTTSGFLRMKLGQLLQKRGVAPHIYEGAEEAREHLRELEETSP